MLPKIVRRYAKRVWIGTEQKARSRKWASENKDRIAAAKRKRWAENPEYYRQKQREYRARKKAEKEALVR